jgi:farnesyl diphosphate synthase
MQASPPETVLTITSAGPTAIGQDLSVLRAALAHDAAAIQRTLDSLLTVPDTAERRLWQAMRYAVLNGGKRLRGFLVVRVAQLFGANPNAALRVAASVEMLHAYSLIHDDLPAMDNDDLRRGQPSCHRAFDEATAILAGDALQTLALELLADPATSDDAQIRCDLVRALARAAGASGMVGGQMADMQGEGRTLTEAEVLHMQALKTGRLLQYSAEAGAILGEATVAQRQHIAAYGRDLGAAFQVADDLLDALATTEELGKSAGKDAASGKATLVALLGIDEAQKRANRLSHDAVSRLQGFGAPADLLRALATYVVSRRN